MAIIPAFHSVLETDRKVYHDSDLCTEGNNIETKNNALAPVADPGASDARIERVLSNPPRAFDFALEPLKWPFPKC